MQKVGLGTMLWAAVILVGVIWFMSSNTDEGQAAHAQATAPASSSSSAVNASSKPTPSAWFAFGKGMYATSPIGKNGLDATGPSLLLTTDGNTGMPMLLLVISPASVCQENGQDFSAKLGDVGTYYVNSTAIEMNGYCVTGKEMMKATPPGMKTLTDAFSGFMPIVTITAPDGTELQYLTHGYLDASMALLQNQISLPPQDSN